MKAKEKTRRTEKSIYAEMKVSDIDSIDRKIHELIIGEGYFYLRARKFEGNELNNYRDVHRLEYMGGGELITVITTHCMESKETA